MTRLSTRQLNLIAYLVAHPELPETRCAQICGVPNSTYFLWKNNDVFMAELSRQIKDRWKGAERIAVNSMITQAEEGSFNASKYILDNLGYAAKKQVELQGNLKTDIEINIIDEGDDDNA